MLDIADLSLERVVGLAYHKDTPLPQALLAAINDVKLELADL